LSPEPAYQHDGAVRLPGLDNHAMGTIFEELIRRFNEENNEEAGEHFTPRDVVTLMANLIFLPVADQIESGTYLVYDGACGTGDAGQGESNIRRWIIEQDWLEAIIALPLNLFYNTGITTYIWVLTNRKHAQRKGKVQLIDATARYRPLRKNLGKKNCELADEDIRAICERFLTFEESEHSKIFPNAAFGNLKISVERPLRLQVDLSEAARASLRRKCAEVGEEPLAALVDRVTETLGPGPHVDFNAFLERIGEEAGRFALKLTARGQKLLRVELTRGDETAAPVIKRMHRPGKVNADPLHGRYDVAVSGQPRVVEYESDPELRDSEQVPLLEPGGIEDFFHREVLPHVPDAWIDDAGTKIGYEISFTRYFYQPEPQRSLETIRADIEALEREAEGLLGTILVETAAVR
jgi:type I restriction enzyme M protein